VASAGLTAEEIERRNANVGSSGRGLRLPQREGMKMTTLSANAQRIGDDIMRPVNARNHMTPFIGRT
jgi:hypothetical protein